LLKSGKNNSKKIIEIICKVIRYFSSLIMVDSVEQTKKAEHIDEFWKETEEYLRESQDFWWLNEKIVDGKKKTQLEIDLEKGRSFSKEISFKQDPQSNQSLEIRASTKIKIESTKNELFAPKNWLTTENYRTYVRRVVDIIQKFKDESKKLDGDTDKAFEELKEELKQINESDTNLGGHRKPHTAFAAYKKPLGGKPGDAWSELKEYAKISKGEIQIDLPGYGLIYLKLNKDIKIGDLRYKETAFSNSTDGFPITRKAFDRAWESIKD
jgi:hypothetical protein